MHDGLGSQGGFPCEGGITQINGRALEGPGTGKVESLRLVMFEDKAKGGEGTEQPAVHFLERGEVILNPGRLSDDGTIIDIRHETDPLAGVAGMEQPGNQRQIQRRQDRGQGRALSHPHICRERVRCERIPTVGSMPADKV
jgi:hypothetical protein